MKAIILYNPLAGKTRFSEEELLHALSRVGIESSLHRMDVPVPGEVVDAAAASGIDLIVAAGGDGTVSTVATGIRGKRKRLGIVPIGSLNHFAKDLRIPTQLEAAVRVIRRGKTLPVDTGELNGRVFLNNSSIGIYPLVVRERKNQRDRNRRKWIANIVASYYALKQFPQVRVRLKSTTRTASHNTPFVFVGNNEYEWTLFSMARRTNISRGELFVCVSRARDPLQTIVESLFQTEQMEMFTDESLSLETEESHMPVAVDGEVIQMETPLHYRIRPRSLEVLVP